MKKFKSLFIIIFLLFGIFFLYLNFSKNNFFNKMACERIEGKVWSNYWSFSFETGRPAGKRDINHCITTGEYCKLVYLMEESCPRDICEYTGGGGVTTSIGTHIDYNSSCHSK